MLSGMAVSTLGDVACLSQMLPALGLSTCAFPPCQKALALLLGVIFPHIHLLNDYLVFFPDCINLHTLIVIYVWLWIDVERYVCLLTSVLHLSIAAYLASLYYIRSHIWSHIWIKVLGICREKFLTRPLPPCVLTLLSNFPKNANLQGHEHWMSSSNQYGLLHFLPHSGACENA